MIEESIDIICQRIAITKEYNDLIRDMNFYNCYFHEQYNTETQKWTGVKQISHKNYDWLEYAYHKYKLYRKIISSWEASHHDIPAFPQTLENSFKKTFEIYESNNYVVLLDSNYLKFKYFIKNFKFKVPCQ